jgi:hypothetical protein
MIRYLYTVLKLIGLIYSEEGEQPPLFLIMNALDSSILVACLLLQPPLL